MSGDVVKVAVIIGSTRIGRFAPAVAEWFVAQARVRGDLAVDVVDLARDRPDLPGRWWEPAEQLVDLPAITPRLAAAGAFVIVTPEYNHSYPGPLKCAIDVFYDEWHAKPIGLVSYGGQGGGIRAVEHLRQVFAELHAVTIPRTISFHRVHDLFDVDGTLKEPGPYQLAAQAMLDQLVWWATALSTARAACPYRA